MVARPWIGDVALVNFDLIRRREKEGFGRGLMEEIDIWLVLGSLRGKEEAGEAPCSYSSKQ